MAPELRRGQYWLSEDHKPLGKPAKLASQSQKR